MDQFRAAPKRGGLKLNRKVSTRDSPLAKREGAQFLAVRVQPRPVVIRGEPDAPGDLFHQAAARFLIAPISAVSIAPPAPPATTCEMIPEADRSPDCAAATTDGINSVTIWPRTPPPTSPLTRFPTVPRSKFGDALPAPKPPSAPATRLIRICSIIDLPGEIG